MVEAVTILRMPQGESSSSAQPGISSEQDKTVIYCYFLVLRKKINVLVTN